MLLMLPAELRNSVYSYALVESRNFDIQRSSTPPKEPDLLWTCRQIRKEAYGVYYGENKFIFHVVRCDAAHYIKWCSLSRDRLSVDGVYFKLTGAGQWSNLQLWLKAFYEKRCTGVGDLDGKASSGNRHMRAVGQLFALGARLRDHRVPWKLAIMMLEEVHKGYAALDLAWE